MSYVELCSLNDVPPGTLRSFFVREREIMVIRKQDQLFCLDARCKHAGAPLVDGKLEDDILTCPWHGSQFRITDGALVRGPAKIGLKVYPLIVKDNVVLVEV